ncbi:MAG: high frequency lysogenization protein HflD [Mariprofundaceae bacterium]
MSDDSKPPHIHANYITAQANRAAALAALVQAVSLVESIARKGICDNKDFERCIHSLFAPASDNVVELYGGRKNIQTGLRITAKLLQGQNIDQAKALLAYSAGLIALEKRLSKNKPMLTALAKGMLRTQKQSEYFDSQTHGNVIAGIANLYGETISTLKPRIIVRGKPEYLKIPANTHKVRVLLLSGIRAAHLWHKHGGGHLRLLIGRKKLAQQIELLQE